MTTPRAAALTLALTLLTSSAFAGTASRSFMVGAVVVRSATVTLRASAADGVHVEQVASRGTPAPMMLVANESKPMPVSGQAQLATHMVATVLY
jgi:pyrimidine deaminase RibD-like protein